MNPHKRLLDLFNFRFKISVIFVYLLCCAQLDVKNDQVLFSVPASSQYLSRPSPPRPQQWLLNCKPYAGSRPPGCQKGLTAGPRDYG